ncbi:hypothetical protein PUNSTDRAFT_48384 [Punctularia strigosozonata HHB-11173 SS5]|uniref:uncharacterized protein n=1 Tax=Punctularia strigosozonata (strain HHB-11173) TaxID=741275 RepID=UPI00044165DB|nr:uncharacterized protein PUNSTDRAFT_48384 [Punctularia strigosozonata HHB-11173 SS5]EIN13401.1 hypothetical protein PUNSTDRAFT_48384 [Punctularia strigosozonata HHB-11173 SS5]
MSVGRTPADVISLTKLAEGRFNRSSSSPCATASTWSLALLTRLPSPKYYAVTRRSIAQVHETQN